MADDEPTGRNRRPRIDCPVCGRNVVMKKSGSPVHHYPPPEVAICYAGKMLWCEGGDR